MLVNEDEIEIIGRMPVAGGGDPSEFDALPVHETDINEDTNPGLFSDEWQLGRADPHEDQFPEFFAGDDGEEEDDGEEAEVTPEQMFPTFTRALVHFKAEEPKSRTVRVDTDKGYKQVVLGADMTERIPLVLPDFAEGSVKCWREGDQIVCSVRFAAADGKVRVATATTKPAVDADSVAKVAASAGVSPTTVLGIVSGLADTAAGQRLVKDVCSIAFAGCHRSDVLGQDDETPVVLARRAPSRSAAPRAALMYVQQRAQQGDPQAQEEIEDIKLASALTNPGRNIVQPLLVDASARLALGQARQAAANKRKAGKLSRYINLSLAV